jgi:hypothetical protein
MEAHNARLRARSRRAWLRCGRILLFGVTLAALQLLLIAALGLLQSWSFIWLPAIILAALFYLLIPALAAFFAARQSSSDTSEGGVGCFVAGISFLLIVIVVMGAFALTPNAVQTPCQPHCRLGAGALAQALAMQALIIFCLIEGAGGLVGGLLGGWLGGLLGRRYAAAQRSSANGENS